MADEIEEKMTSYWLCFESFAGGATTFRFIRRRSGEANTSEFCVCKSAIHCWMRFVSLGATRQFRSPKTKDSAVSRPCSDNSSTALRTTSTGTCNISESSAKLNRVVNLCPPVSAVRVAAAKSDWDQPAQLNETLKVPLRLD